MARPISIMDLVTITGSATPSQTIADTVAVAQEADRLGYKRYWVPEHHNHLGLAFTSTEVMIAHLGAKTERIRVGAAGIMLPNHAPLKVAETFRTLEALYPGRIDLGLGRAPGTDGLTAYALRGNDKGGADFPQLAGELFAFLYDQFPPDHPYAKVIAAPIGQQAPDVFILGSSEFGPRFAAVNGLTAVFAHHQSPHLARSVLRKYREDFVGSELQSTPYSIVSVLALATDDPTIADAAMGMWALFIDRIRSGERGPRPSLAEVLEYTQTSAFASRRASLREQVFAGPAAEVAARLTELADDCQVDEIALLSPLGERDLRISSLRLLADQFQLAGVPTA